MGLSFREKLRSSIWWPHTQPHQNPYIGGYRDAASPTTPSITITPTTKHSTANAQLIDPKQLPSRSSSISERRPSTTSTSSLVSTSEKSKRSSADRSRSKSRKRDIFWKDGLWNAADPVAGPRGKVVKARSSSVGALHPSVAEEMMKEDQWRR